MTLDYSLITRIAQQTVTRWGKQTALLISVELTEDMQTIDYLTPLGCSAEPLAPMPLVAGAITQLRLRTIALLSIIAATAHCYITQATGFAS